jgi:hypothetical protein
MHFSIQEIQSAAMEMKPTERASLAAQLIESLEEERNAIDEEAIERLWIEEVERRIARVEAGLEEFIPAEKVLEELRKRNR